MDKKRVYLVGFITIIVVIVFLAGLFHRPRTYSCYFFGPDPYESLPDYRNRTEHVLLGSSQISQLSPNIEVTAYIIFSHSLIIDQLPQVLAMGVSSRHDNSTQIFLMKILQADCLINQRHHELFFTGETLRTYWDQLVKYARASSEFSQTILTPGIPLLDDGITSVVVRADKAVIMKLRETPLVYSVEIAPPGISIAQRPPVVQVHFADGF